FGTIYRQSPPPLTSELLGWAACFGPLALAHHRKAYDLHAQVLAGAGEITEFQMRFAEAAHGLGEAHRQLGSADEAIVRFQEALTIWQKLGHKHPDNPECPGEQGRVLASWGQTLAGLGRHPEARDRYERALALFDKAIALPKYRALREA